MKRLLPIFIILVALFQITDVRHSEPHTNHEIQVSEISPSSTLDHEHHCGEEDPCGHVCHFGHCGFLPTASGPQIRSLPMIRFERHQPLFNLETHLTLVLRPPIG